MLESLRAILVKAIKKTTIMENRSGNIFKYIALIFLAGGAFVIIRYFTRPKEVDIASIKDMNMFIQNAIYETDQKLSKDSLDQDVGSWISWYKSSAALYNDAKSNKDREIKQQSKILKEHLLKVQVRDFPELRENYVNAKKEVLSQKHVSIEASGRMNDTLNLTGEMFESSKQKKQFLRSIDQIARDLRFKKVIFKWSGDKDSYADYDIESKEDTEI
jgi:hypothetical protein